MDLTSASLDFSIIGPEIALLVAASIILAGIASRAIARFAPEIGLLGIVVSLALVFQQWGMAQSGFFGMVTCDGFGATFKLIFLGTAMIALLMARKHFAVRQIDRPEFYAMLLISTIGMMAMANSTDLVTIFIGLEVMSVPLYVMAAMARKDAASNEAGIKYFIMGAFASSFLVMGIALVLGATDTTDLRRIAADFECMDRSAAYLMTGVAFLLVGFGFKVAVVPFHSWVPDVYQGAPTPVTAFFSVGPKAAGFAALLRIFTFGFESAEVLIGVFAVLAVLTMTVGNVLALRQNNIKRLLAYSSIAHAGYILAALVAGGNDGRSSAIFYLIAYGFFNLGGFAVLTLLENRTGGRAEISELAGLSRRHPYLAALLALFMFALSGFPPTVGFFGKFYIFKAIVAEGHLWLAIVGVLNSFVSVYYYLRLVKAAYFDQVDRAFAPVSFTPALVLVLIVTALGTLGMGLFPEELLDFSTAAIFAYL